MATDTRRTTIPLGPMLSMYDKIFIGLWEDHSHVTIKLAARNLLGAGEPGGGKSGLAQTIMGHAALAVKTDLVMFDGKQVEFGLWKDLASEFVGPDLQHGIQTLRRLIRVMDNRYMWLLAHRRRKVTEHDDVSTIVVFIDELALYTATLGSEKERDEFERLLRDLVARGRAAGIIVVAFTQRPSAKIVDPNVRDLFAWRAAFHCTSQNSSDIILGQGWVAAGYDASKLDPENHGTCLLLAEGGVPRLMKAAWLSDAEIENLVDYAIWLRQPAHTGRTAA